MKNKIIFFLIFFIFLVGFARSFYVISHKPIYALANSYDMLRLQACHNIMPADKIYNDGRGTPDAPLKYYKQVKKQVGECFLSSESFFVYIGISIVKIKSIFSSENFFDIRIFGLVRLLGLSLFAFFVSYVLYKKGLFVSSSANALLFTIIFSDPGVTIYANTFYTEYSSIFGLYLSLSFIYLFILLRKKYLLFFAIFGLLMLGFSKPQHMLLPIVIVALFTIFSYINRANLQKKIFCSSLILMVVAFFILGVQLYIRDSEINTSIKKANAINTFLFTFSPRAQNKNNLLSYVGLPEKCSLAIGKNFISIQEFKENPCPEIIGASRVKLLTYFFKDPKMFLLAIDAGTDRLRPFLITLYGHIENEKYKHLNNELMTIDNFIKFFSKKVFYFFLCLPIIVPILILAFGKLAKLKMEEQFIVFVFPAIMMEVFFISILGDGLGDFGKHNHLSMVVLFGFYVVLFNWILWKFFIKKLKLKK